MEINGNLKSGLVVHGPNGVHKIALNDKSQPTNASLKQSIKLNVNTILAALDHPKTYVFNLGGDRIDISGVAKLLSDETTRKEVLSVIQDGTQIRQIIELISGAKYGVFATDTDSVSFEIVRKRLFEEMKYSIEATYVVANLFTPFRTIMGLAAASYQIQTLTADSAIYPKKADVIRELEIQMLETAISEIDFSFIKNDKKKIGVGDIATKYERALYPLVMKFQLLAGIKRNYETVLALVRSYVLKDFDNYSPEELAFFDEERFLALATNISIVKHALESKTSRPAIGSTFWLQSVEKIGLGIAASSKYNIIEIGTVREFYTISSTSDLRGLKNGLIISRNLAERSLLKTYRKANVGEDFIKLYEDKTTEAVLGGIYSTLGTLDSTKIHHFVVKALQNVAAPDGDYVMYTMNVPSNELEYLGIIFAQSVLLDRDLAKNKFNLIYQINTEGSLIADELSTFFSYGLVTDPMVALFYTSDFEGKRSITIDNNPISDVKHTLFHNVDEILTEKLGGSVKFKFTTGSTTVTPEWELAELTGLVDLEDIHAASPLIGSILFDQLISSYNHLVIYYTSRYSGDRKDSDNSEIKYALDNLHRQFLGLIAPILKTRDIDHLLSSAISQIWNGGLVKGTRFGSSILMEDRVKVELRVRLMIFVAIKLGFIKDRDAAKKMIAALSEAQAFERLIITA